MCFAVTEQTLCLAVTPDLCVHCCHSQSASVFFSVPFCFSSPFEKRVRFSSGKISSDELTRHLC